ncbi:hypothetical protein SAPIO_CDS2536 [Scedosporium apiospermum]|uniref:Uncharacterized protein n=1 Tax=Pseudallescheria apiosperma TaxID=563466 RepID=A0A084GCP2_PSEDA|nr:uncharacterized protein SAPIO_CDS2536 [Scedosporium apiospermum]KEZ45104.1 hypothetical protein SAPIO_CDS2536 [Scedosporium apiospermum]
MLKLSRTSSDLEEILNNWETIEPGMEPQPCRWEDVMAAIETAKETYAMKATNKGRAVLRNMATIKTLQALSQVVPEQDGLSVLRGGLTLVFKLIERRIENQERILKTLGDIPFIFERACNDLLSFGADEVLVTRVRDLYSVLLRQIAMLLRILLRKQKGSGEAIKGIERKFGEGSEHLKSLGDRFEAMERRMINIEASVHTCRIEEALFLNTNVFHLFAQNILQAQHITRQITGSSLSYYDPALPPSPGYSQSPQPTVPYLHIEVSIEQIFDIINIDPVIGGRNTPMAISHLPNIGHVADDMEHVLRQSGDLQESALRRTNWLLATDRFLVWLRSDTERDRGPQSDLILINGQCDEDLNNSVSALSVFCATLISMMITIPLSCEDTTSMSSNHPNAVDSK